MSDTNDHDLLVEIKTKLERAIGDIRELKDNLVADVDGLKATKADQTEIERLLKDANKTHADYEKRIRFLERWLWIGFGIFGVIQFALTLYVTYHK